MATITIHDLPDETRAELEARAARRGRSTQDYLRLKLVELAAAPERAAVLERISRRTARTRTHVGAEQILAARDADRRAG